MIAEMYLRKREEAGIEKGRREERAAWMAWYEANRERLNGVRPPPFMRDLDDQEQP